MSSAVVEMVDADCAVPSCDEFTVGHESPVMPGLTEDGQLVSVTLQWCPKHADAFDLVLTGFCGSAKGTRRQAAVRTRFGYEQAVAGFISA